MIQNEREAVKDKFDGGTMYNWFYTFKARPNISYADYDAADWYLILFGIIVQLVY